MNLNLFEFYKNCSVVKENATYSQGNIWENVSIYECNGREYILRSNLLIDKTTNEVISIPDTFYKLLRWNTWIILRTGNNELNPILTKFGFIFDRDMAGYVLIKERKKSCFYDSCVVEEFNQKFADYWINEKIFDQLIKNTKDEKELIR